MSLDQWRDTATRDGSFNSLRLERGNSILMDGSLCQIARKLSPALIFRKFVEQTKLISACNFPFLLRKIIKIL